jgi:hypothetical protein
MATFAAANVPLQRITMLAKNAVTAGRLVKLNTTEGQALHTIAITEVAFGVAMETVADGLPVSVEIGEGALVRLTAHGAITAGDALMPDAADGGKVQTLAGATAVCCGLAIQGAADGAEFTALFSRGVRTPAPT